MNAVCYKFALMSEQKGLGSKFLGLFVEKAEGAEGEGDATEKSPADLVAELAAQSGGAKPGARPAAPAEGPPPNLKLEPLAQAAADKPVDFDAVFRSAGMDGAELDRVKKAEELLKSLPESTPHETKKQIVEASLKAFGFEIEKIVQAASNQKRALDTYVKVNESATAKAVTDAEAQIKALEEKIAGLKGDILKRTQGLGALGQSAAARKAQVQKVLDFFARPPAAGPTP
ncbi:MAG: hypothetical protein K1X89_29150 [Myxococcaceae bacterium]|nr:hypothetical protein [Myxococcaceae bacterium]